MNREYIISAKTDVGICKEVNQDNYTVHVMQTPFGEAVFAILCDGMGGLSSGEIASSHLVKLFKKWFENSFPFQIKRKIDKKDLFLQWKRILENGNNQIIDYGEKEKIKLGTTASMILIFQKEYYIAHIGDSRIYEISENINLLTTDHTFVARQVRLGRMTNEEAQLDRRKNVLTRCIGINRDIIPEYLSGTVSDNGMYLICSDGFRHEITNQEILDSLKINRETDDYEQIKEQMNKKLEYLIDINKKRGERDNISAILICIANPGFCK